MAFREFLDELSLTFTRHFRRGDVRSAAAAYEVDAELFLSGTDVRRGRDQIEAAFVAMIAGYAESGEPIDELTTLWTTESGDLACAIQEDAANTYCLCFRRQAAEGWLIAREVVVAK